MANLLFAVPALCALLAADNPNKMRIPPELDRLSFMLGRWEGTSTSHTTDGDTETLAVKVHVKRVLDGYHLQGEFEYATEGSPYQAHAYWSYAVNEGVFVLHWIDNSNATPTTFKGRFHGGLLTLSGKVKADTTYQTDTMVMQKTAAGGWTIFSSTDLSSGIRATMELHRPK